MISPTEQAFEEIWRKADGSTKEGGRRIFEAGMATATLIQSATVVAAENWRFLESFLRDLMERGKIVWGISPSRPISSFTMSWRWMLRSIFGNGESTDGQKIHCYTEVASTSDEKIEKGWMYRTMISELWVPADVIHVGHPRSEFPHVTFKKPL